MQRDDGAADPLEGLVPALRVGFELFRRNLRKKDEEVLRLQKEIGRLEDEMGGGMQAYDYNDDALSVKSRLVKPLRGGLFQR